MKCQAIIFGCKIFPTQNKINDASKNQAANLQIISVRIYFGWKISCPPQKNYRVGVPQSSLMMFPKVTQSPLGILRVPQLPLKDTPLQKMAPFCISLSESGAPYQAPIERSSKIWVSPAPSRRNPKPDCSSMWFRCTWMQILAYPNAIVQTRGSGSALRNPAAPVLLNTVLAPCYLYRHPT